MLQTVLVALLIVQVFVPSIHPGLVLCIPLLGYVLTSLFMAGYKLHGLYSFLAAGVGVGGYLVYALAVDPSRWSWNVFYLLFGAWMLVFRWDTFYHWNSRMSTRRKLAISTWSEPKEGNIYGELVCDMGRTLEFLAAEKAAGRRITVTHLVIKAVSLVLHNTPSVNGRLVFGRYYPAQTADVGCLVSLPKENGVPDLANVKVCDGYARTLSDIAADIRGGATKLRTGKDEEFKKSKPMLAWLPTWLLKPIISAVGWLASLGASVPALGITPTPFGTAVITSLGMMGLDRAYVPFTPFAHVPLMVMVGALKKRPVVEGDAVVAKDTLLLTITADHRFLDGATGAPMLRCLRECLEAPEELLARCAAATAVAGPAP